MDRVLGNARALAERKIEKKYESTDDKIGIEELIDSNVLKK